MQYTDQILNLEVVLEWLMLGEFQLEIAADLMKYIYLDKG